MREKSEAGATAAPEVREYTKDAGPRRRTNIR